jgi:NAD-dependent SIR2 family protein deacetylase
MVREKALKGQVAKCEHCSELIKPDITFFGESLPKRFFDYLDVSILQYYNSREPNVVFY